MTWTGANVLRGVSVKLPQSMIEKLEEIAGYEDRSVSAQIRVFLASKIRDYFAELKTPPKDRRRKLPNREL